MVPGSSAGAAAGRDRRRPARWQGSKYAISVATGTAALHVSLAALGIGPGDEVIVPSYTFIATSFSVVQAGTIPRFADVNLERLVDPCEPLPQQRRFASVFEKRILPPSTSPEQKNAFANLRPNSIGPDPSVYSTPELVDSGYRLSQN